MSEQILFKRSLVTSVPTSLADGEIAFSLVDGKIRGFIGMNGNVVEYAGDQFTDVKIQALIASLDVMTFKGGIDASTNPNYPSANAGDTYKITVPGKIGGTSGVKVEAGDTVICTEDNTAAGNQVSVGIKWLVIQANIDGAVVGPTSSTDNNLALFDGVSGKLIKDSGVSIDADATLNSNSDNKLPTQKAVKKYVDDQTTTNGDGINKVGTAISVKRDTTTGATAAPVKVSASGVAVEVDNQSIVHVNGVLKIGVIDGGTF